tara:strand:+ start:272 stop:826 length:555 start_codon:yes stop_codon:yes gene_type:complete
MPKEHKLKYSKEKIENYCKLKAGRKLAFGFEHCQRVYKLAKKLGSRYDDEILHAAAFLHDIERGKDHEKKSANHAALLLKFHMGDTDIFRVQEAIYKHTALGEPKSVEAILVHDAALLDCLGGVGMLQLALAMQDKKSLKDLVKHIKNHRNVIAEKLVLKQSKSLAADRIGAMDLMFDALEKEL